MIRKLCVWTIVLTIVISFVAVAVASAEAASSALPEAAVSFAVGMALIWVLVGGAAFAAQVLRALQVSGFSRMHATLALHRFQQHSCRFIGYSPFEGSQIVIDWLDEWNPESLR